MGVGIKSRTLGESEAVFLSSHGSDDIKSVTVITHDQNGHEIDDIKAGQILVYIPTFRAFAPRRIFTLTKKFTKGTGDITLDNVKGVNRGDVLRSEHNVYVVNSVNNKTNEITLAGGGNNQDQDEEAGALLTMDYMSALSTKGYTTSDKKITVSTLQPFVVDCKVGIKGKDYTIKTIDNNTNEITLDRNLEDDIEGGVHEITNKTPYDSRYLIARSSVKVKGEQNPLVPTQSFGRVKEAALIGFDPSIKAAFPSIVFDKMKF